MFLNLLKRIFDNTPEQDNPKPEISELVYQIVMVFKASPKRFKFKFIDNRSHCDEYLLTDIITRESFLIKSEGNFYRGISPSDIRITHRIHFSTIETEYLFNQISPYIQKRIARVERMYDLIKQRSIKKEESEQKQLRNELYKKLSETS